jgi:hypothetical protein
MPEQEKIIFPDDKEAARYLTGIEGWVSRRGQFYGDTHESEEMARWDGATHVRCRYCSVPVEKSRGWTACYDCREKKAVEKWESLPEKKWCGSDDDPPVYSEWFDAYFYDMGGIEEECEEHGITIQEARLVICEPQYPPTVDPEDHLRELMPDDGDDDIPADILDAFDRLNEFLRNYRTPLSWVPGRYRVKG